MLNALYTALGTVGLTAVVIGFSVAMHDVEREPTMPVWAKVALLIGGIFTMSFSGA